ncbi:MAG: hypothetical protein LBE76_03755 [Nitrososphaerota archaeon]|nr:hypothetical protein [Nitrososphaerota archaeon]
MAWVLLRNQLKHHPVWGGKIVGVGMGLNSRYGLALLGIILIVLGGFLYSTMFSTSLPSVVIIGSEYINVECKDFVPFGSILFISSNKNITSNEIAGAFIGQLGSGDFTLNKQHGTNFGETNIGVYTLGNGAKAYIATTNSTSLIVELKTGEYLIVGNQDTQTIAECFSQNVYQLSPIQ